MTEPTDFRALLERIRAGDQAAAAEMVRRYEPAIRRAVRVRLADPRLGRLFDSLDVSQSVFGSFFEQVGEGAYQLETPEQLLGMLVRMARNKLASAARHATRQRRDHRRAVAADGLARAARSPTPSAQVAAHEMLDAVRLRLSPEERQIVELRQQGHDWEEIGRRLGASPEALRKRLARAVDWALGQINQG